MRNLSSLLEYDELQNYSMLSATQKTQNLSAIIVNEYSNYFSV